MKNSFSGVLLGAVLLLSSAPGSCASSTPKEEQRPVEPLGEWSQTARSTLADGVVYTRYALSGIDAKVHLLEVDLTNPKIMVETVMADEICPNPNHNANSNNGPNLRETLSETCLRRRAEGRNIVAGVNTGFFNSHEGFPRGYHIEYDEPVFINNPYVHERLQNHRFGFAFFADRSCSSGERSFEGTVQWNGVELPYYSVNDTVLMQRGPIPQGYEYVREANLYTSRFRLVPHPERPEIRNEINSDALFVVGQSRSNLKVNCGYIDGSILRVVDGRGGLKIEVPTVMGRDEWVLRLTGAAAERMAAARTGDPIRIAATVLVGGEKKPIVMYNAGMHHFLTDGAQTDYNPLRKPATVIGIDASGTQLKIVCVEGITSSGSGMNYEQLGEVMKHVGACDAVRFDGGGSTSMWIYDAQHGAVVCRSCDSNGPERSCMNYLQLRILE